MIHDQQILIRNTEKQTNSNKFKISPEIVFRNEYGFDSSGKVTN